LTSPDTASSIYQDTFYPKLLSWENFDKQVILQSQVQDINMWDIANHYTLAVNNAETMFVTTSQEGYPKLAFINIQDNY
jgi:hypothetical protein